MKKSESIKEIAGALALAQVDFPAIKKDKSANIRMKSGGEFTYGYADLQSILSACLPLLNKQGISVVQTSDVEQGLVIVTTTLMHSSGEFLEGSLSLPIVETGNNAIQAIGSTITYARRYHLSGMIGVASEADDDANGAGSGKAPGKAPVKKGAPKLPPCPKCGEKARADKEDANQLYCWKAKGGCGHRWKLAEAPAAPQKNAGPPSQEAPPPSDNDAPGASKDVPLQKAADKKPPDKKEDEFYYCPEYTDLTESSKKIKTKEDMIAWWKEVKKAYPLMNQTEQENLTIAKDAIIKAQNWSKAE